MHVSPLEEYALRCVVSLAKAKDDELLSASKVSELEGISVEYASKIFYLFRHAGLVESVRGVQGGFRLSREPSEISIKEVFDALQIKKKIDESFCDQYAGSQTNCVHLKCCSVRPVWDVLSGYFDELLRSVSIADLLVSGEEAIRGKIHALAWRKAQEFEVEGVEKNVRA